MRNHTTDMQRSSRCTHQACLAPGWERPAAAHSNSRGIHAAQEAPHGGLTRTTPPPPARPLTRGESPLRWPQDPGSPGAATSTPWQVAAVRFRGHGGPAPRPPSPKPPAAPPAPAPSCRCRTGTRADTIVAGAPGPRRSRSWSPAPCSRVRRASWLLGTRRDAPGGGGAVAQALLEPTTLACGHFSLSQKSETQLHRVSNTLPTTAWG